MNDKLANDLIRYAELVEDGALISPEEMNCASVMRLAAEYLVQPAQRSVSEHLEPVAWQDTAKPTELVAAEDWENIDPQWHWMYRPLYTTPPPVAEPHKRKPLTREQRIQIVKDNTVQGYHGDYFDAWGIIDDVEAAHGIKEAAYE